MIALTSARSGSLWPLWLSRLTIRVSLIFSFASRGATSTAFAICLMKRQSGVRSKETAGTADAGGRLPSGAGGAAWPAFSARSAVLSARNTKPIRDIVQDEAAARGGDDDVLREHRPERLLEPRLGLGAR